MTIISLEAADYATARAFVQPYERFCIPLMARLLTEKTPAYAAVDASGEWHAVFTFSKAGQLFHCIPLTVKASREELYMAFCCFFRKAVARGHAFFSVNGEQHGTHLVVSSLAQAAKIQPARTQRYDFMRSADVTTNGKADFDKTECKIVRCTPSMAEELFPLQTAYEKEEVVFNLATYSEDVSLLALKKALREQVVFAAYQIGGILVAKGGTNAQGIQYVQFGGVYTVPSERGKGYASVLIRYMCAVFATQGKRCALFVKPDNVPAVHLYERCGFTRFGVYETAYF